MFRQPAHYSLLLSILLQQHLNPPCVLNSHATCTWRYVNLELKLCQTAWLCWPQAVSERPAVAVAVCPVSVVIVTVTVKGMGLAGALLCPS